MKDGDLVATARALVAPGKGILAADESGGTIAQRYAAVGLACTPASRLRYRRMVVTTPGLAGHISGVILYDETVRQSDADGHRLVDHVVDAGMIPGIKVDLGTVPLPGSPQESVTEGLDGLRARLEEYRRLGARFTKWRAAFTVGPGRPSEACCRVNAAALGRFAALSQEAGLVPVVEPDVVIDGSHSVEAHAEATRRVIVATVDELRLQGVDFEGMLLKTNMALPGNQSGQRVGPDAVADRTLRVLSGSLPAAVPGVVFLSGGQPPQQATANLDAINRHGAQGRAPWELAFSFNRALLGPTLEAWAADQHDEHHAQAELLHRAACNAAARSGGYTAEMERRADRPALAVGIWAGG